MHFSKIICPDIANGIGCRCTIFVSGCNHHCKGCFNPDTWDFNYGLKFNKSIINEILNNLSSEYIQGLTILGGEPLEPVNQKSVLDLIKAVRNRFNWRKDIWLFTGCIWEDLLNKNYSYHLEITKDILSNIDILVDGPFIESKKDISLKFRGSSNQRIIYSSRSIALNRLILSELNS